VGLGLVANASIIFLGIILRNYYIRAVKFSGSSALAGIPGPQEPAFNGQGYSKSISSPSNISGYC
jgi:hypothetical protein